MRAIDHTGIKYGRLTGIERAGSRGRRTIWLWQCECGSRKELASDKVTRGHTVSCGCYWPEVCVKHRHAHDASGKQTRTYKAWVNMRSRADGRTEQYEKYYRSRGITVYAEWEASFEAFLRDMGECPPGMSLDRRDNDRGYEPGNCRWATPREQAANMRSNVIVRVGDVEMPMSEACRTLGLIYDTVMKRIHQQGMSPQQAIEVKRHGNGKRRNEGA